MTQDLSQYHEPVTDLFPHPVDPEAWEKYRLSDDQIAFFHENGYVSGVRVLDDRQLESLRAELTTFFNPDHDGHEWWYEYASNESRDPSRVLFHALGAWRIGEAFHDLLWHPAVTVPASQLLEGSVRFWHDQLFCKPAHHGGVVAWHQDYSYWTRTRPMTHLTCWIGLDEAKRDNGCLNYIPGSHRWPLLNKDVLAGEMDAVARQLTPEQKAQFHPVPIELKAGEATFHHPLMLHGSYENSTDRPRRATVVNMFRDGVKSAKDEPLLKGVPAIPAGQPMGGQFFPLLFSPQTAEAAVS